MKKLIIALGVVFSLFLVACTDNQRAKYIGGSMTVTLPKGQKLMMATWKEGDLWYLVEEMEKDYIPKTKNFIECSEFGMLNGKVTFIENR